ncbi:MAG: DUF4129 domain-containing protein [Phenylobacterium sp.]
MDETQAVPQYMGREALARLHPELLKRKDLQFDFPDLQPPEPPPAWIEQLVKALEALAPVLKVVFWAGLAAGAVLVAVLVIREVQATYVRRRAAVRVAAPADWRPEAAAARALLEDADRLASEGRFAEAVHLLLFRSIDDLAGRRPGAVRPALTSRDIAGADSMPRPARAAFARIAQIVETSFFGGRPVGAGEFGECRRAYEAYAFAEGWS